jgi:sigma-B regulation protein RsbQ
MTILERNNIHIHGNENAAQTIVFGHGFGTDQTSFYPVMKAFENDYKIVLFDNVGGGKSDIKAFSQQRYSTLQGYVADLIDIFKELNLQNVIYVGQSVNGMVGLLTSIKHPGFFSKIITLGASPRYLNDKGNNYHGGFEQDDLDQLYQTMTSNYVAWASGFSSMVMANADRPHLAQNFAKSLSAIRPDMALQVAKAIFQSDYRSELNKVTVPVLIVQTTKDVAVPENVGSFMNEQIPGSKITKVNIEGHFPHISAPQEVVDAIKSFI